MTELKDYYDKQYREFGSLHSNTFVDKPALLMHILQGWYEGKTILDFGCGMGELAGWMAHEAERVVGVDYSREAVDLASRHQLPGASGLTFQVGTEHDLPDGPFGLITCMGTLEHTDDPGDVLGRFKSVMAPDGMMVVQVPNWLNPRGDIYNTCRVLMGLRMTLADRHWISPHDMETWCRDQGLVIVRLVGGHYRLAWGDRMVEDLEERIHKGLSELSGEPVEAAHPAFKQWLEHRASLTNLKLKTVPAATVETQFTDELPWSVTGASAVYFIRRQEETVEVPSNGR